MSLPETAILEPLAPRGSRPRRAHVARSVARTLFHPAVYKGMWSVLDQALVSGTSFFTAWMIARSADSQLKLGTYSLALTLILFMRGIQEQGISGTYMIYCHRRQGHALAAYTGSTMVHHLTLSFITVICLLAAAGTVSWLHDKSDGLAQSLWVLAAVAPFLLLREFVRSLSFAHLRPWAAFAMDAAIAVLQLGALAALVLYDTLTIPMVFAILGGACAAGSLGWLLARRQPMQFLPAQFLSDFRNSWPFAKWATASQLLGSATPYALPWILALAHGRAATGILAASMTLVGVAQMFVTGMGNFLTPKAAGAFAQGGSAALGRVLAVIAAVFTVTLGTFCLSVAAAGEWIPTLIYNQSYAAAAPVIAVLSISMLMTSLSMVAGSGLWAMERPAAAFNADVLAVIATFAAAACLVCPLGALGAAMASLAGATTACVARTWMLLRMMKSTRAYALRSP